MRKLSAFIFITLNGCYKGPGGDISWHRHGEEEGEYSAESLRDENTLIFGRVTYDMMASFWPTPAAAESMPRVAEGMNKAEKIVFSKSLQSVEWENTRIISGDMIEEVRRLKGFPGNNMTILGSGSIVTQLAQEGLIDHYEIMIDPTVIANGTSIFQGITGTLNLKLLSVRTFKSGVVLLSYEPLENGKEPAEEV